MLLPAVLFVKNMKINFLLLYYYNSILNVKNFNGLNDV